MSSTFRCKFCDDWLEWSANGKLLNGNGSVHDCPNSPWKIARRARTRAHIYKKEQLRAIDDFALLVEIRDKMRFWQSRLVNYDLDYSIKPKQTEAEESKQ